MCQKDIVEEDDILMCQEISKSLSVEPNLQKAYNDFRKKKELHALDFNEKGAKEHHVVLCLECLLECFRARRVEAGNIELDEVSCYRGTIMQGIGLTKHGHYSRKLGDELGIPRKRLFENN